MSKLTLKIKKLHKDAKLPAYQTKGDAGFDLCAIENVTLAPSERASIPTGIAMEIPYGYVGLIWDKSGLSHKFGLKTLGGVADAGYRGEIKVGMINLGKEPYTFEKGHKMAQMVIQKREEVDIVEAGELSDSERGEGGFGSTGK
ncbi:MAG TPA: dUTP diphosphatase [Candidatus Nanoarchaeia archaeon]|nr:dUTP diphosphatase [Candidatus Nanoarchaeia archaeon]